MAQQPKRREVRRPHLDAAVVPMERALLERARALSQEVLDTPEMPAASDEQAMAQGVQQAVCAIVSRELLGLAEELHWWG